MMNLCALSYKFPTCMNPNFCLVIGPHVHAHYHNIVATLPESTCMYTCVVTHTYTHDCTHTQCLTMLYHDILTNLLLQWHKKMFWDVGRGGANMSGWAYKPAQPRACPPGKLLNFKRQVWCILSQNMPQKKLSIITIILVTCFTVSKLPCLLIISSKSKSILKMA